MPYDEMTEAEYQEYHDLYSNTPTSIKGRAERFIELAHKGWINTRAADDCFENGDGDAVLSLVLKKVKASPPLQELLKHWGYWSSDWKERLQASEENSSKLIVTEFNWKNMTIELLYRPHWSKAVPDMAHLSIQVVEPERNPLPITETGYLSHFFHAQQTFTEEQLINNIHSWLDEEAQAPRWKKKQQEQIQLTLF